MATLGAANENDFVVPFPGISRRHAQFVARPGGLWFAVSRFEERPAARRPTPRRAAPRPRRDAADRQGVRRSLEEISSSDADITLVLPPPKGRPRPVAPPSSDTDPLFETGGYGTPGSALALVRRIEFLPPRARQRHHRGPHGARRQTLGAALLARASCLEPASKASRATILNVVLPARLAPRSSSDRLPLARTAPPPVRVLSLRNAHPPPLPRRPNELARLASCSCPLAPIAPPAGSSISSDYSAE